MGARDPGPPRALPAPADAGAGALCVLRRRGGARAAAERGFDCRFPSSFLQTPTLSTPTSTAPAMRSSNSTRPGAATASTSRPNTRSWARRCTTTRRSRAVSSSPRWTPTRTGPSGSGLACAGSPRSSTSSGGWRSRTRRSAWGEEGERRYASGRAHAAHTHHPSPPYSYTGGRTADAFLAHVKASIAADKAFARVAALDALAASHAAAPDAASAAKIKAAAGKMTGDAKAHGELYARYAAKGVEKGASFFAKEASRLERMLSSGAVGGARVKELAAKVSVLSAFAGEEAASE